MQAHVGLFYFVKEVTLVLNIFLRKLKNLLGIKKRKVNIFRVQANNSVMYDYFCIGFIDFMLTVKKWNDFTCLFSPHNFDKNDDVILSHFKDE